MSAKSTNIKSAQSTVTTSDTTGMSAQDIYKVMFREYPDVLDVKQVSELLGVSTKTVYRLLRDGTLASLKVGREFKVPKLYILQYFKVFGSDTQGQRTS